MRIPISTTTRIAIGLTSLTVTSLLAVTMFGLVPDGRQIAMDGRCALAEAVAVQCCLSAQRNDLATMRTLLDALVVRNNTVLSAGVRRTGGDLVAEAGTHGLNWLAPPDQPLAGAQVKVPIFENRKQWGTLEVRFLPLSAAGWRGWLLSPMTRLFLFVAASVFLLDRIYLKKILKFLDPTSVVPQRVRATLDTLAEGVVILDNRQQIVLANKAFADRLKQPAERLQGFRPSDMRWSLPNSDEPPASYPWLDAVRDGVTRMGVVLRMRAEGDDGYSTLSVNAIPILGGNGERRGALATFDDVTRVEQQNVELEHMLGALRESRDEIQRQNLQLHMLATYDPLTQCLNRRSFFEKLELHWTNAQRYGHPLSFIMVDVDHFKAINDRFGHAVGDVVLKKVGETLRIVARDCDLVCRYGGEEFCILLPQQDVDHGVAAAERYRTAVATLDFERFAVTASFGVSASLGQGQTAQDLIEQADRALYAAKHGGRNRVIRWDSLPPEDGAESPAAERREALPAAAASTVALPFATVAALTSALAYRDTMTAERSRRVAELCVAAAAGLMSQHECRELEMAAMLHDIGKLAIPDAILLKPGKLTPAEWAVMRSHDRIGVEILKAAGASPSLIELVATHHAWYAGSASHPSPARGDAIPAGARILAIADAFIAMVTECHYRKGMSRTEAFAELRRGSGTQFDPALVERFIEVLSDSDRSRPAASAAVSKESALDIGLEIERLAVALDSHDFAAVSDLASHLAVTAARAGAAEVAWLASQLEQSTTSEPDLLRIIRLTTDLLDLCRWTQSRHLRQTQEPVALPVCEGMSPLGSMVVEA